MDRTASSTDPREKVTNELKTVIREAEDLLKNADQPHASGLRNARERIENSLHSARNSLGRAEETLLTRTKDAALSTDKYVHNHAWQSVGMGALAGLVMGLLIGRR